MKSIAFKVRTIRLVLEILGLLFTNAAAFGQGPLTPPTGPTPGMKSLDQIESRTPISSAPFTIAAPGSYYLTQNLTVSTGTAININASGVTLDLNGFTISSTSASPNGTGILITGARNVTIKDGFIQSNVILNGNTFSGSGFVNGINFSGVITNILISRVSVAGVLGEGIDLGTGDSTIVESCTVRTIGGDGIVGWHVRDCAVRECGSTAIYTGQVENSTASSAGSAVALQAIEALNCSGINTAGTGGGVDVSLAQNCQGRSSAGTGLNAVVALNCQGSSTNGDGMHVSRVATNCYGMSTNGRGLYLVGAAGIDGTANSCYGATTSTDSANGGLTSAIAIGCYGIATQSGAFGIVTTIANSSSGSPSVAVFGGGKWDMP